MSAYTVLVTKEIDPALIQKAKQQNVELRIMPFIEVIDRGEKTDVAASVSEPASVVFTSRNAVNIVRKLVAHKRPRWKIYCIEGGTSEAAEAAFGQAAIAGTARDARSLAALIVERKEEKVFFFCGERRRDELPDLLRDNNITVEESIVYETRLKPEVIGQHFDGIAFFSPSAAESFFTANVIDDVTIFYAIGETTAAVLKKLAINPVITSPKASEEAMVDTILSSINKVNGYTEE